MKTLFKKYKSVITFILTFLSVYTVLSFAYKGYLEYSKNTHYYPDYITNVVSNQSEFLLNVFSYKTEIIPHPDEPSMKIIVNNKYVGRMIEGCNSISVIILFLSFIVAFAGAWKPTLVYIFIGSTLIYIVNLLRIIILSIGLYKYPSQEEFLHNIVFPLIIYGMVFLLWVFWVNRLKTIKTKHE